MPLPSGLKSQHIDFLEKFLIFDSLEKANIEERIFAVFKK
jgi:hypothetical protein